MDIRGWWQTQCRSQPPTEFGWGIKIGAAAGLILAYGCVVPLKVVGYLPITVTWLGVVLVPAIWFLAISSVLILPVRTVRERRIMMAFSFGCLVLGFGAVYWQGWV